MWKLLAWQSSVDGSWSFVIREVDRRPVSDNLLVVAFVELFAHVEFVPAKGQEGRLHAVGGLSWVQFELLDEVHVPETVTGNA